MKNIFVYRDCVSMMLIASLRLLRSTVRMNQFGNLVSREKKFLEYVRNLAL